MAYQWKGVELVEGRLEKALLEFVEGYAKKAATAEEVQALAAVAEVLVSLLRWDT